MKGMEKGGEMGVWSSPEAAASSFSPSSLSSPPREKHGMGREWQIHVSNARYFSYCLFALPSLPIPGYILSVLAVAAGITYEQALIYPNARYLQLQLLLPGVAFPPLPQRAGFDKARKCNGKCQY